MLPERSVISPLAGLTPPQGRGEPYPARGSRRASVNKVPCERRHPSVEWVDTCACCAWRAIDGSRVGARLAVSLKETLGGRACEWRGSAACEWRVWVAGCEHDGREHDGRTSHRASRAAACESRGLVDWDCEWRDVIDCDSRAAACVDLRAIDRRSSETARDWRVDAAVTDAVVKLSWKNIVAERTICLMIGSTGTAPRALASSARETERSGGARQAMPGRR